MSNTANLSKYVLAILHDDSTKNRVTYYHLESKDKARAFAEAATKATKAKDVFCWLVLIRDCKVENAPGYAFYKNVIRVYPSKADTPDAKFGAFDDNFASDGRIGRDWGYLSYNDIH